MYKVLIVDDESYIRNGLVYLIDWQAQGCQLTGAARDGADALEQIRRIPPDIVISDIHMGAMSGLELAQRLCEEYPRTKCILFTGIYEFNSVYNAIKYNVVDLILKPTSPARIQQALSKAIQQLESQQLEAGMRLEIQRQNEQNLRLKQALLLSNLVEGSSYGPSIPEALASVELRLHHFAVVTLLLGGAGEEEVPPSYHETEKMIYNYIDQLFEDMPYFCAFSGGRSIHIVLDFPKGEAGAMEEIRRLCDDLNRTIDNLTEFYSTIGISAFYTDPAALPQAAKESVNASNYALYDKDTSSIVEYAAMPPISADTIQNIRQYIARLSDAIESASHGQAQEILDELGGYFAEAKLSLDEIRNIGMLIANLCIRFLWDHNCFSEDVFSSNHDYYRGVLECAHAQELQLLFSKIIHLTVDSLVAAGSAQRNIIELIEAYIRQNYASDLSLTKIAGKFHLSTSYLSRLFKSRKGVSLITYIQQARIERAKELIALTDLRTYEIAEQVGISDPVYFSKMFKKFTGMRVRDYRARAQEEQAAAATHTDP